MSQSVNRLKELLFDGESQRLAEVARRVDTLAEEDARRHEALSQRVDLVFDRVGSADRLQASVAAVIDGVLRDAEVARHEQLSRALAPLVVKTIKHELKNSEAEMVDALYPITGKLVKQYVTAAIADLMAQINQRLGGKSVSEVESLAKSQGLSVAEYVLSETQKLDVEELFLIRRGSGLLVGHWERRSDADASPHAGQGSNRDALIAGYISGIAAFAEEAFTETRGSLRTLDLEGQRIMLRASQGYILAARIAGSAPMAVEQAIDATFLETLERHQEALSGAAGSGTQSDAVLARPSHPE